MTNMNSSGDEDLERAVAGGNRQMKMAKEKSIRKLNTINKKKQKTKQVKLEKSKQQETSTSEQNEENSESFQEKNLKNLTKNEMDSILETRDLLVDYGANGDDLNGALDKLEAFLGTSQLEYEAIDSLTNDLMKEVDKLTMGLAELDDIFGPENEEKC